MSRIDDLMAALAPSGVQHKTLGDVGEFVRGNGLQKSDLTTDGVGAIHYGQIHTHYGTWTRVTKSFVEPELAAKLRRAKTGDLVIATTSEDDAAVAKATAWLGDDEVAVSGDAYIYRHTLDPRFVAYFFQSEQFQGQKKRHITGTKVRRISGGLLAKIRIPVPPIRVQQEIVRILDNFTELETELESELESELEARRSQYAFYRDSLLTFPESGGVRRVPLGEILAMRSGHFISASNISRFQDSDHPFPCFGGNGLRGYVAHPSHDGEYVLIGRQGALSGNVKRVSGKFYATEHAVVATVGTDLQVDWAFHMLTAMNLNQYVSKGAQPGLAVGTLNGLPVAVPPIDEQSKIAIMLDKFDAFVNELSVGLPAELAARRKQYEHYRDRLLTFEEAAA